MLLVKTKVSESNVHGLGLFTNEPIRAGQRLWQMGQVDVVTSLKKGDPLYKLCFVSPLTKRVVLCLDNAAFWNFPPPGTEANCVQSEETVEEEFVIVAARDIEVGEELFIEESSDLDVRKE